MHVTLNGEFQKLLPKHVTNICLNVYDVGEQFDQDSDSLRGMSVACSHALRSNAARRELVDLNSRYIIFLLMNELEDVKKAAEEYMKKQIQMFSLMTLLTPNDMLEFKDWFNRHPYNALLKGIPQSLS